MVLLIRCCWTNMTTSKLKPFRKPRKFIDSVKLCVRGGAGGMGYPKFGGVGGNGGNVIIEAKEGVSLKEVMQKYSEKGVRASKGVDSNQRCILGKCGANHIVFVPVGVNVVDDQYRLIGELNEPGKKIIVARGGPGGCSETGYSGIKGESQRIGLDLKLIADIGLVGFPNAGKSTLLNAITDAKPKIASYPFTTIKPNVGCIKYPDLRNITVADLPGLIEDAHRNVGMGHRFLRHCERTKMLIFVVDINGFQLNLSSSFRNCLETVVLLNKEIELYRECLLDKPALLLINKMDVEGSWNKFNEIKEKLHKIPKVLSDFPIKMRPSKALVFDDVIPISAKTSVEDIDILRSKLRSYIDLHDEENRENTEKRLLNKLKCNNTNDAQYV